MIWGLGTAAAHSDVSMVRQAGRDPVRACRAGQVAAPAGDGVRRDRRRRDRQRRARASGGPQTSGRLRSIRPGTHGQPDWPWPEPRLTYANAVLAEAMIAAGVALDDPALRQRGLDSLEWLLNFETADGHLSPTPAGGRGPEDSRPAFDQQPIEVATPGRCVRPRGDRRCAAAVARGHPVRRRLVPGRQRRRTADVGPGDRRRVRRAARRRGEPQPGRGVDACGDIDLAAGTALFACPAMT